MRLPDPAFFGLGLSVDPLLIYRQSERFCGSVLFLEAFYVVDRAGESQLETNSCPTRGF